VKLLLELDKDAAEELSLLLGRAMREGRLEADLVHVRERLTELRVALGWLAPTKKETK
jgi:hypothetical protein